MLLQPPDSLRSSPTPSFKVEVRFQPRHNQSPLRNSSCRPLHEHTQEEQEVVRVQHHGPGQTHRTPLLKTTHHITYRAYQILPYHAFEVLTGMKPESIRSLLLDWASHKPWEAYGDDAKRKAVRKLATETTLTVNQIRDLVNKNFWSLQVE